MGLCLRPKTWTMQQLIARQNAGPNLGLTPRLAGWRGHGGCPPSSPSPSQNAHKARFITGTDCFTKQPAAVSDVTLRALKLQVSSHGCGRVANVLPVVATQRMQTCTAYISTVKSAVALHTPTTILSPGIEIPFLLFFITKGSQFLLIYQQHQTHHKPNHSSSNGQHSFLGQHESPLIHEDWCDYRPRNPQHRSNSCSSCKDSVYLLLRALPDFIVTCHWSDRMG